MHYLYILILIRITTFPPSQLLSPYVHMLWTAVTTDSLTKPSIATPPSGFVLLTLFPNNSRYYIKLRGEDFKLSPRAAIQGQHYGPVFSKASSNDTSSIGIMFKTVGFYKLFHVKMSELTHRICDAEVILGSDFTHLMDHISAIQTDEQRISIVSNYLEAVVLRQKPRELRGEQLVDFMLQHGGTMSVGAAAEHFKITTRAIERAFQEQVGVSPKYLNRIIQFNKMLQMLKATPTIRWTELATRAGYYDQAHLIKAFIEFTGQSPVQYDEDDHRFTQTHLEPEADKDVKVYE